MLSKWMRTANPGGPMSRGPTIIQWRRGNASISALKCNSIWLGLFIMSNRMRLPMISSTLLTSNFRISQCLLPSDVILVTIIMNGMTMSISGEGKVCWICRDSKGLLRFIIHSMPTGDNLFKFQSKLQCEFFMHFSLGGSDDILNISMSDLVVPIIQLPNYG